MPEREGRTDGGAARSQPKARDTPGLSTLTQYMRPTPTMLSDAPDEEEPAAQRAQREHATYP